VRAVGVECVGVVAGEDCWDVLEPVAGGGDATGREVVLGSGSTIAVTAGQAKRSPCRSLGSATPVCPPTLSMREPGVVATSDDSRAKTSGGYWYHQCRGEPTHAVRDQRFQDEPVEALARFTATSLPQHEPKERSCAEQ